MSGSKIEWLGTGSGLNVELGNTSFLAYSNPERALLVDCGFTVPARLQEKQRLESISHLLITHLHADHIGGLETFGFYHYFVSKHRNGQRPILHLPTDELAHKLWNHALKAGMGICNTDDGQAFTANLETYYHVKTGLEVNIDGLPKIELFETPHVTHAENYGLRFDNGVYYSGDTTDLPPHDPSIIFHDCQFFPPGPSDIHISYDLLRDELPAEVKQKTHLVHLGLGYASMNVEKDGFAGMVRPGQIFDI